MVVYSFQPHGRCWLGCMSSINFSWKRSCEDASKLVLSTCKKPTTASSCSSRGLSIFLTSTASFVGCKVTKNTNSGTQNQRLALSYYGCIPSSHHCTTSLTKHAASGTKLSFHCSVLLLLLSQPFSMEMQSVVGQTRSPSERTNQTLLWGAWLVLSSFSEAL